MRSSKSKLKASVYWRTRGQFWKLNQVQLFRDQNERRPNQIAFFNARACDRTGSRDRIRQSGNRPLTCVICQLQESRIIITLVRTISSEIESMSYHLDNSGFFDSLQEESVYED